MPQPNNEHPDLVEFQSALQRIFEAQEQRRQEKQEINKAYKFTGTIALAGAAGAVIFNSIPNEAVKIIGESASMSAAFISGVIGVCAVIGDVVSYYSHRPDYSALGLEAEAEN